MTITTITGARLTDKNFGAADIAVEFFANEWGGAAEILETS